MTYLVTSLAEYRDLEAACFRAHCEDRGVSYAAVRAGTATLDTLDGKPVFPPITTRFTEAYGDAGEALVLVTPSVSAFQGRRSVDASGRGYTVNVAAARALAQHNPKWATVLARAAELGKVPP